LWLAPGPAPGQVSPCIDWKARWAAAPARSLGLVVLTSSDQGAALPGRVLCLWYRLELRDAPAECTR
jgi:hypothetical protein